MASKAEKASNRQIAIMVLIGTMIGAAFPFNQTTDEGGESSGSIASFVDDSLASLEAWLAGKE